MKGEFSMSWQNLFQEYGTYAQRYPHGYEIVADYEVPVDCIDGSVSITFRTIKLPDGRYICDSSHAFQIHPDSKPYHSDHNTGETELEALKSKVSTVLGNGSARMDQYVESGLRL